MRASALLVVCCGEGIEKQRELAHWFLFGYCSMLLSALSILLFIHVVFVVFAFFFSFCFVEDVCQVYGTHLHFVEVTGGHHPSMRTTQQSQRFRYTEHTHKQAHCATGVLLSLFL